MQPKAMASAINAVGLVLSLATTPRGLRKITGFNYGPILEVACLFLGIFITMQPPMEILQARGHRELRPAQALREAEARALGHLVLDQEREAILERSFREVGRGQLAFQGIGHALEA